MVSSAVLFGWFCVAATALLSVDAAPVPPPCDLGIASKVKQKGVTGGGASVSTTSATQGSGTTNCVTRTPNSVEKKNVAGNTGVTATSVSAGDGAFGNLAAALTLVEDTEDGLGVKTKNGGKGFSEGTAAISQTAGANGGATVKKAKLDLLTDGEDLFDTKKVEKGTVTSSSSHQGSGAGDSIFEILNEAESKIKKSGD
uniref:Cement protein-19k n=1 Tax=Megabalanus rosa TaxID=6680 RepID=Q1JUJ6_MEGRO|nr:cement protein-19k [Megabalanus rosa]